jgi:hypothetical protein
LVFVEDRLALFKDRKQELVRVVYENDDSYSIFQIEEVKNKETYAVAKSLLEKYGEIVTPTVQSPTPAVNNANKGMSRNPDSTRSIFPYF